LSCQRRPRPSSKRGDHARHSSPDPRGPRMGFVWPRKTNPRRRIFPAANPRANQCRHPCAPRRPQISVSIRGKTSARRLSADLGSVRFCFVTKLNNANPPLSRAGGRRVGHLSKLRLDRIEVVFDLSHVRRHFIQPRGFSCIRRGDFDLFQQLIAQRRAPVNA